MLQELQMRNWRGTAVRERATRHSCILPETAAYCEHVAWGRFSSKKPRSTSAHFYFRVCLSDCDNVGSARDWR